MKKICLKCKVEFETNDSRTKFCCKKCATIFNNKSRAKPDAKIICAYCKIDFVVKYKYRNRKFCSKKCSDQFHSDPILGEKSRKNKSIGHIGKEPYNKNKTFEEMYGENAKEMKAKCRSGITAHPDIKLICSYCSKEYLIKYHDRKKSKYCSHKCFSLSRVGVKSYVISLETRKKMSEARKGKVRIQSQDEIKNRRIRAIKIISERLENGQQMVPNWNPKACDYFEQFDKDNNTSGHHARNGGEFYIKELGYWVDYINHDLKLIIEYDEDYHFKNGILREKDVIRQQEIQKFFKDYEFKRIKYNENTGG